MRRQVAVVLAAVLVSAPIVGAVDLGVDEAAGAGDGVPLSAHGDDHPPIRIHGDEQFLLPSSGVTGGSGTAEDPYVIEGWTVKPVRMHRGDAFQDGDNVAEDCKPSPVVSPNPTRVVRLHGIEIVDTSKHVVIENVTVVPREDTEVPGVGPPWNRLHVNSEFLIGILLRDADNVTIRNVTVGQADGPRLYRGICAKNSDDLRIRNSTVQRTVSDGVQVHDATEVGIVGSEILDSAGDDFEGLGIDLETVSDVVIAYNEIRDHAFQGLAAAGGGKNATVHNNTFETMSGSGVSIGDHKDITVVDNVIADNGRDGVSVSSSAHSPEVHRNNIVGNAHFGVDTFKTSVDATKNWWGCTDGPDHPDCDGVDGDVTYDPWLESPNDDAGA